MGLKQLDLSVANHSVHMKLVEIIWLHYNYIELGSFSPTKIVTYLDPVVSILAFISAILASKRSSASFSNFLSSDS